MFVDVQSCPINMSICFSMLFCNDIKCMDMSSYSAVQRGNIGRIPHIFCIQNMFALCFLPLSWTAQMFEVVSIEPWCFLLFFFATVYRMINCSKIEHSFLIGWAVALSHVNSQFVMFTKHSLRVRSRRQPQEQTFWPLYDPSTVLQCPASPGVAIVSSCEETPEAETSLFRNLSALWRSPWSTSQRFFGGHGSADLGRPV